MLMDGCMDGRTDVPTSTSFSYTGQDSPKSEKLAHCSPTANLFEDIWAYSVLLEQSLQTAVEDRVFAAFSLAHLLWLILEIMSSDYTLVQFSPDVWLYQCWQQFSLETYSPNSRQDDHWQNGSRMAIDNMIQDGHWQNNSKWPLTKRFQIDADKLFQIATNKMIPDSHWHKSSRQLLTKWFPIATDKMVLDGHWQKSSKELLTNWFQMATDKMAPVGHGQNHSRWSLTNWVQDGHC